MSNSLWPHGLQHTRIPCPSSTPRAYSNSCPLSWWCHPTMLSSVVPFSSCLQSFPTSGSFQMSQFFVSGSQSIGVPDSASVPPINIQDWFPLGWTGWISLQFKGFSRVFSNTTVQKHHSSVLSFLYSPTLTSTYDYWKNHSFDYKNLAKWCLCFLICFLGLSSGPITSCQIDGETMETVAAFIFLGSKITADGDCSHEIKDAYSLEEKL